MSGELTGNLEERQHTLELVQERINSLESQLIAERNSREAILKDITVIHFLQNPFSRLPRDLLPLIFKFWEGDPFWRNRTLCLVCKTWYHVVWSSTSFWTDVILRPDLHANKFTALCRFAELCSLRSIDEPLDVVIDFSAIVPYNVYIGQTLDKSPEAFSFFPPGIVPQFAMSTALEEENPNLEPPHYTYSYHYESIPQTFMRQIVDQNNEPCRRWRSLHIILPNWPLPADATHKVLHEMKRHMKNLVEMDIRGREIRLSSNQADDRSPLPHFPRLKSFTTTADVNFNHMSLNYTEMKHICIRNHNASWHFLHIATSDFSALLTLELFLQTWNEQPLDVEGPAFLPQLTSLTLAGFASCVGLYVQQIHAPKLERLHLQHVPEPDKFAAAITPFYQTVKSMLLEGSAPRISERRQPAVISYEVLSMVLRNMPSLVFLRVKESGWGTPANVLTRIQAVREEGHALKHLKEVTFVAEGREFLTEDASHLAIVHVPAGHVPVSKGP